MVWMTLGGIMDLMKCNIFSCDNFRVGILVNSTFVILGLLILVILHIALVEKGRVADKIKDEIVGHVAHIGYTLYLIAGGAFFGAIYYSGAISIGHVLFATSWMLFLFILLLLDALRARFEEGERRFSLSRILAIPMSLAFIWWLWTGAYWSEKWLWMQ